MKKKLIISNFIFKHLKSDNMENMETSTQLLLLPDVSQPMTLELSTITNDIEQTHNTENIDTRINIINYYLPLFKITSYMGIIYINNDAFNKYISKIVNNLHKKIIIKFREEYISKHNTQLPLTSTISKDSKASNVVINNNFDIDEFSNSDNFDNFDNFYNYNNYGNCDEQGNIVNYFGEPITQKESNISSVQHTETYDLNNSLSSGFTENIEDVDDIEDADLSYSVKSGSQDNQDNKDNLDNQVNTTNESNESNESYESYELNQYNECQFNYDSNGRRYYYDSVNGEKYYLDVDGNRFYFDLEEEKPYYFDIENSQRIYNYPKLCFENMDSMNQSSDITYITNEPEHNIYQESKKTKLIIPKKHSNFNDNDDDYDYDNDDNTPSEISCVNSSKPKKKNTKYKKLLSTNDINLNYILEKYGNELNITGDMDLLNIGTKELNNFKRAYEITNGDMNIIKQIRRRVLNRLYAQRSRQKKHDMQL